MNGLRINQLEAKLGLKRSTIYKLISEGQLPKPIKFGRASIWLESEVEEILKTQANNRLGSK
jgi:prophage regulatory protein